MSSARDLFHCLPLMGACAILFAGCERGTSPSPPETTPTVFPVDALGRFHQANGHIEMNAYTKATALLTQLRNEVGNAPSVLANLAVSQIGEQKFAEAEALARKARAEVADHAGVAVILAAALEAQNRREEAIAVLHEALAEHPDHLNARWALTVALENHGVTPTEIAAAYDGVTRLVPKNLVAVLGAARAHADAKQINEARAYLERAIALIGEPPAAAKPYLDQMATATNAASVNRAATILRNLMRQTDRYRTDVMALGLASDRIPPTIAHPILPLSDAAHAAIDADIQFVQRPDLLGVHPSEMGPISSDIAIGAVGTDRTPALYLLRPDAAGVLLVLLDGAYVDETERRGLDVAPAAVHAVFMDVNNDRLMDLLLSATDGDRLFVQQADGRFADETEARGLADAAPSRGALPFDFDNEGDLDLIRWTATGLAAHRNDGEGRFSAVAELPGIPMDLADVLAVHALDFDDDGDIDLAFRVGAEGPFALRVFSNERLGQFMEVTEQIGGEHLAFTAPPVMADIDNDGWFELVDPSNGRCLRLGEDFEATVCDAIDVGVNDAVAGAALDIDRDGRLDLVFVAADGSTNMADDGVTLGAGERPIAVDLDLDGAIDILGSQGTALLNNSTGTGHWLTIALKGLVEGDSRNNAYGIGSVVEVRAGALYQRRPVDGPRVHFGLGPYKQADVVRILWPNGNYQNLAFRYSDAMGLAADREIVQEQLLKGSCPYLYAWNGERFVFVTDVLWRSALGMAIMADVFAHHGPADDYFKIDGGLLRPRDGRYVLQFTEELQETAYLDYVRLFVVDHPVGTDFAVDEKCVPPPYPPFTIYPIVEPRPILHATDERRRDLTDLLARADQRFVTGFETTRYQGIVETHDLILDLGAFEAPAEVHLFLRGWLWPTDASVNVAVSQNPTLEARPPALAVRDASGAWQTVIASTGFPSGKNKTIVLDLTGLFPTTDHHVRIRTNFAIFWDHAFCTVGPQAMPMRVTELPVTSGDLHDRGTSRAYQRALHGPTVPQYDAIDPHRIWREQTGWLTRYGDVTPLLHAEDSMYAIVGAGDEVTLTFDADAAPPLPEGWRRDFIIHTDGWLKDGDLNSATGKTVEPLPFHGMSDYPYPPDESYPDTPAHRAYRRTYNTRWNDRRADRPSRVTPSAHQQQH